MRLLIGIAAVAGFLALVEQDTLSLLGRPAGKRLESSYYSLTLASLLASQHQADTVVIDARAIADYNISHIPGAVPLERFVAVVDGSPGSASADQTGRLVVYCSDPACGAARSAAVRLLAGGWRNVAVYDGGFAEWRLAGLPVQP